MKWFIEALKKYAVFSGRARRKEYWMYNLFIMIFLIVALILSAATGLFGAIILLLFTLAIFIPSLSVTVRRLHDTGRSGWWYCILFVPIAGPIVLLVFTVQAGRSGDNEFGSDPKAAEA